MKNRIFFLLYIKRCFHIKLGGHTQAKMTRDKTKEQKHSEIFMIELLNETAWNEDFSSILCRLRFATSKDTQQQRYKTQFSNWVEYKFSQMFYFVVYRHQLRASKCNCSRIYHSVHPSCCSLRNFYGKTAFPNSVLHFFSESLEKSFAYSCDKIHARKYSIISRKIVIITDMSVEHFNGLLRRALYGILFAAIQQL